MDKFGLIATMLATSALAVREPSSSLQCSGYNDDLADVGAMFRRRRRNRPAATARPASRGPSSTQGYQEPVGLGATAFTAASGTALPLTGTPLKTFKGRRLVIDFTRSGATATGLLTITTMMVGSVNQMPQGVTSLPVAAYGAQAINNGWSFSECPASVPISMGLAISLAPTAPDRVDVSALIHGEV